MFWGMSLPESPVIIIKEGFVGASAATLAAASKVDRTNASGESQPCTPIDGRDVTLQIPSSLKPLDDA